MFDLEGIEAGSFNDRQLDWLNWRLGVNHTVLNDARRAFAIDQGAASWEDLTTIPDSGLRITLNMVDQKFAIHDGSMLVGYAQSEIPNSIFSRNTIAWGFTKSDNSIRLSEFSSGEPRFVVHPLNRNALGYFAGTGVTNVLRNTNDWLAASQSIVRVEYSLQDLLGQSDAAIRCTDTNTDTGDYIFCRTEADLPDSGDAIWASVFVGRRPNPNVSAWPRLQLVLTSGQVLSGPVINPESGLFVGQASSDFPVENVEVVSVDDYWWVRFSMTPAFAPETVTSLRLICYPSMFTTTGTYLSNSGLGTNTFALPMATVNQFPHLPILSANSATTVSKDDWVIAGLGDAFPAASPCWFCWRGFMPRLPSAGAVDLLNLSDGTSDNRLRFHVTTSDVFFQVRSGGSIELSQKLSALPAEGEPLNLAGYVNTNDGWFAANGSLVGSDTSVVLPSVPLTDLDIMQRENGTNQPNTIVAHIRAGVGPRSQNWGIAITS